MKSLCAILLGVAFCLAALAADEYPLGPDSKVQPDVPKGDVLHFALEDSKVFPGTRHEYWVYVPQEYTTNTPACVFICQDGISFEAPKVFDNLIYKKEMPVTIGVFVRPGVVPAADKEKALDRFNRSFEYDGLGDAYARFLLEELLPAVEKQSTPDGRAIRLSHSGNDRAIGGLSSGAICAFTAAWERPQEFSRVFSAIGTYVDLRGGMRYQPLIRKFEPKPIRVFLQDGTNDLNIYGGDWWMANQTMERALTFAGYEVNHAWGTRGHDGQQATAIFPDAMRWLWKDWPQSVTNGVSGNPTLTNILIAGEGWEKVFDKIKEPDALSVVNHRQGKYVAEGLKKGGARIWLTAQGRGKRIVDANLHGASGLALSPDQTLLYVADGSSHWVYSYVIKPDGSLTNRQQYYWLHQPDTADDSGAGGMCVDRDGRLYVATKMGVQVCDQAGRVQCILPTPEGGASNVWWGGESNNVLYAQASAGVFKRKLNAKCSLGTDEPHKPAAPRL